MRKIAVIAFAAILCGCNIMGTGSSDNTTPGGDSTPTGNPPGSPAPLFDLNGQWRFEAAGDLAAAGCITVANLRVTAFDDGCNGNTQTILRAQPAYVGGKFAGVYFNFGITGGDSTHFGDWSFQLTLQDDGSLAGTGIKRIEPSGPVTSGDIVWVRQ